MHEQTQQYLTDFGKAIERHSRILESLSRPSLPAETSLMRTGSGVRPPVAENEADAEPSADDDLDLQIMKETLDLAHSLADTISTRGSVVGWTNSDGTTRIGSNYGDSQREIRNGSGEIITATEDALWNEEPSMESGRVQVPAYTTDAATGDTRFLNFRRDDSLDNQANDEGFPSELMTNLLENYISAAEKHLLAHRYYEAKCNLIRATREGEKREALYNYPFNDKLKIEINLAAVHIELEELDLAETMLDSLDALTVEDPLKLGEVYYLMARLHRARYCRDKNDALLRLLETAASRSYLYALNSAIASKPFLVQSAEIMVETYQWEGDDVAAGVFRDRHPSIPSIQAPAMVLDSALEPQVTPSSNTHNERDYSPEAGALPAMLPLHAVQSPSSSEEPQRTASLDSSLTSAATSTLEPIASVSLLAKVQEGDVEMVKFLLASGADIEQTDVSGLTPLLIASKLKHYRMCRVLLTNKLAKANIHAKGKDGRSVLHVALFGSGREDIITLLLEHNADPNVTDEDGKTPLHYCVEHNKRLAAQHLLSKNAEKETLSRAKETALYSAIRKRRTDLVKILLEAGAAVDRKTMPPTSQDIDYMVENHRAQLSRHNSASTAQTAASKRSWLRRRGT